MKWTRARRQTGATTHSLDRLLVRRVGATKGRGVRMVMVRTDEMADRRELDHEEYQKATSEDREEGVRDVSDSP